LRQNNSITDLTSIPKEMIFASGSGLDPHISPEAAFCQLERVVTARNFNAAQKTKSATTHYRHDRRTSVFFIRGTKDQRI